MAAEREFGSIKLTMKALDEKIRNIEAKRVKELNDDNVLIALNAFEDGEKGREGTGESATKAESTEEQEQRSDESDD